MAQPLPAGGYYCFPHQRMVSAVVAYLAQREGAVVALVVKKGGLEACLPRLRSAVRARSWLLPAGCVQSLKGSVPARFEAWLIGF